MSEKITETINCIDIDIKTPSILERPPNRFRRCPIMVTLADPDITIVEIQALLESGMNIAKFRVSRSSKGEKLRLLGKIDKAAQACCIKSGVTNWPVATCIELRTCLVNTSAAEGSKEYITLKEKSEVLVNYDVTNSKKCNTRTIFVDDPYLIVDVRVGTDIFIGDEVILKCIKIIDEKSLQCIVTKGGKVSNYSRVFAKEIKHSRPLLTREDYQIIKFALEYQVDMIMINYVCHPDTIQHVKKFIKSKKIKRPLILSGICTKQCLENIDDLLKQSDAILMSRDYLLYETNATSLHRLPNIQKWLAGKCIQAGKPLFLSGGIFEVALSKGKLIYSEVSDVTNALMDDVSGFLLNECHDATLTAEVLNEINNICYSVEPLLTSKTKFKRIIDEVKLPVNAAEAAVISCAILANQINAPVIVIPTISGEHHKHYQKNVEARIFFAINYAVNKNWLLYGDTYVTLERGSEFTSFCDTVRIWKVSISKKSLVECPDAEDDKISEMD